MLLLYVMLKSSLINDDNIDEQPHFEIIKYTYLYLCETKYSIARLDSQNLFMYDSLKINMF